MCSGAIAPVHTTLSLPSEVQKTQNRIRVKYWEIIAPNIKKRGWSLGYVSGIDSSGRTIWIADAHRSDGQRFIVRADEKLTAFVELERVTCNDGHRNQTISKRIENCDRRDDLISLTSFFFC